ncbi:hypothetical protein Tco_0279879 [Tanacetum coccineum]
MNQRTVIVAGARETVGNQVVQQIGIQYFNCKGFGYMAKECRKPKWVKDYAYHKEKMMLASRKRRVYLFVQIREIGLMTLMKSQMNKN